MTSIKGLFAIGECNFSDHGANRLGASALMQGLADGYFVLPYTIQNYLADQITVPRFSTDLPEFAAAEKAIQDKIDWMMNIKGKKSVDSIHKELGHVMWEYVGMGRTAEGLKEGLKRLKEIRKEFEKELFIPGEKEGMNVELDKAIRLYDFITMGELVAYDALNRNESCGGHFREEYQTEEGEAKRDDHLHNLRPAVFFAAIRHSASLVRKAPQGNAVHVHTHIQTFPFAAFSLSSNRTDAEPAQRHHLLSRPHPHPSTVVPTASHMDKNGAMGMPSRRPSRCANIPASENAHADA